MLVAGDGQWENRVTLPIQAEGAHLSASLEQAAASAVHDIAVEVFWPDEVFVGVRWRIAELSDALAGAHGWRSLQVPLAR
jgi:hypothetical protein